MIVNYLLKVAIIQLFAFGLYHFLFASTTLHRTKRWYLLLSLALAFLVPFITVHTVILPDISSINFPEAITPELTSVPVLPETKSNGWPNFLLLAYLAGTFIGAARLLRSYWLLLRQRRVAVACQEAAGARWYALSTPVAIHSFGRSIFYGVDHPPSAEVRAHELAHVLQRHTIDRLFIRLLRVLCWYNPVLFLYERAIIHNHELLADTAAIKSLQLHPRRYQIALLTVLSGQQRLSPLSSYLPFSFTKKRFLMLQQPLTSPRNFILRLSLTALAWIGLLFAFGHTAYAQQHTAPPPPPPAPAAPPSIPPAAPMAPPAPPVAPSVAPPAAPMAPPAPPAAPSAAPPAPPAAPALPCPPPPPPTLEHLKPYLELPYAEYLQVWFKKEQEQYPDCVPYQGHGVAPGTKVRDWFLLRLQTRLKQLTETLEPISQAALEQYLDPAVYGVWLDQKRIDNAKLKAYPRTEIYRLHKPSRLYKNARNYGKYTYHLELTTQAAIDKEVRKLREDIAFVKAN